MSAARDIEARALEDTAQTAEKYAFVCALVRGMKNNGTILRYDSPDDYATVVGDRGVSDARGIAAEVAAAMGLRLSVVAVPEPAVFLFPDSAESAFAISPSSDPYSTPRAYRSWRT